MTQAEFVAKMQELQIEQQQALADKASFEAAAAAENLRLTQAEVKFRLERLAHVEREIEAEDELKKLPSLTDKKLEN